MKIFISLFLLPAIIGATLSEVCAQQKTAQPIATLKSYQPFALKSSPALQTLLQQAVNETLTDFADKKVSANDVAATLIDLRDVKNPQTASVRGDRKIYPASVVKLFYLVAAHQWMENGKIKDSPEFERGLRNMIVDSSNDATNYVLDVLTDTGSGGELAAKDLEKFGEKRNAVNRYFASHGFSNINVNQKTYYEDAYGRERQFRFDGTNRNMLTTDATARLLAEIVTGKAVSIERSRQMMNLLKRDFSGTSDRRGRSGARIFGDCAEQIKFERRETLVKSRLDFQNAPRRGVYRNR